MLLQAVIEFLKNTGTSSSITYAFLDNLTKSENITEAEEGSNEINKHTNKNEKILECLRVLVDYIKDRDTLDVPHSNKHHLGHDEAMICDGDVSMDNDNKDRKRKSNAEKSKKKKQKTTIEEEKGVNTSKRNASEEPSLFSSQDICTLIIPWVVKRICTSPIEKIVKEEKNHILWEALDLSLDGIIVNNDTSEKDDGVDDNDGAGINKLIFMTLNQSSLQKIIHVAARVALSSPTITSTDGCSSSLSSNAANVFSHLIPFYTPTFDNALKIILDIDRILLSYFQWNQLSSSVGRTIEDIHPLLHLPIDQVKVVLSALHLVYRRLLNSNTIETNVKRLCSKEVLIALARLSLIRTQTKEDEADVDIGINTSTNSSCMDYVQKILWSCLYDFQALDFNDYRKVLLPSIVLNSDKKEISIPKFTKNKKNCPFTYRLFYILQDIFENFFTTKFMTKDKNKIDSTSNILATAHLSILLFKGFVNESAIWDQLSRHSSKYHYNLKEKHNKRDDTTPISPKIVLLQFRFWALTIQPILQGLVKCTTIDKTSKWQKDNDNEKEYKRIILSLFQCLANTLTIVIKDDVYLPSYEDKGQIHYMALASVAKQIVRWVDSKNNELDQVVSSSSSSIDSIQLPEQIIPQVIILFHQLLDLNHYLLHDHLSTIILFTMRSLNSNKKNIIFSQFLSSLLSTYSKLRQFQYFIECILHVAEKNNDIFDAMWNDKSIVDSLVSGVKNLPSGQVTLIWKMFDDWIVTGTNNKSMSDDHDVKQISIKKGCLQFGVKLFVLFIQSLNVDKSIASTLQTLCEESMSSSINCLLKSIFQERYESTRDVSNPTITSHAVKQGLLLLHHLIELYSQCHFWLNPIRLSNDAMSSFLLTSSTISEKKQGKAMLNFLQLVCKQWGEHLINSSDMDFVEYKFQNMLGEIQHLAIYQIQHLQSMLFLEQEQGMQNKLLQLSLSSPRFEENEIEQGQNTSNIDAKNRMKEEIQLLVDFCFSLAINRNIDKNDARKIKAGQSFNMNCSSFTGWDVICKHLPLLAQLTINPEHITKFLTWMFSLLAIDDKEYAECSLTIAYPLNETISVNQYDIEQKLAASLLQDVSFYEVNQVAKQVINIGIGSVISLIQMAFVPLSCESRDRFWEENITWNGISILASFSSHTNWCSESLLDDDENLTQLLKAYEEENESLAVITKTIVKDYYDDTHCRTFLNRALLLLKIMNSMPREYILPMDKNRRLHVLFRVDIVLQSYMISSMNMASSETKIVMLMLLISCRSIIANDLSCVDLNAVSFITINSLKPLLHFLFRSTTVVLHQIITSLEYKKDEMSSFLQQYTNQIVYQITKQSIDVFISSSSSKEDHSVVFLEILVDVMIQVVENSSNNMKSDKTVTDYCIQFQISFVQSAMNCLMTNFDEMQFHRLLKQSCKTKSNIANSNMEKAFTNLKSFVWLKWFTMFEPSKRSEQQETISCLLADKYFPEKLLLLCDMLIYWQYTKRKNMKEDNEASIMSSIINALFYALSDMVLLQQQKNTDFLISPRIKKVCISFFSTLFVHNLWSFGLVENSNRLEENMVKLTYNSYSVTECKYNAQNKMDTVFCQMIGQITSSKKVSCNSPKIDDLMKFLLKEMKQHMIIEFHDGANYGQNRQLPSFVNIFHLVLNSVKKHPTTELSNLFRESLFLSLNLLTIHPKQRDTGNLYSVSILPTLNVISASIVTSSGKKDIISLTNRELSVIFSQISAMFLANNDNIICSKIFCQCCRILCSFLNHNLSRSQRIYSTIPCFIFLVKSMLLHLLRIRNSSSGKIASTSMTTSTGFILSSSLKLRDFSSLCECMIPYKDILKKHIIGLLICYSDFLSRMDPIVKKEIMPAIFSLLDICSGGSSKSYEIQELNSRMKNPMSKSLFKSVYQSYNKFHKFKGQC